MTNRTTKPRSTSPAIQRRTVIGASAAALATLSLTHATTLGAQHTAVGSGGGAAGGGTIAAPDGEAIFSVFGSRFELEGRDETIFFGSLRLHDAAWEGSGVVVQSTEISVYGPDPTEPDRTRLMSGLVTMNGEGSHPFTLRLVAATEPGAGDAELTLAIGAEGSAAPSAESIATPIPDPIYDLSGTLTSGDLTLLTFDFDASET